MKKVSVLVPCYNEEKSLPILYEELLKIMNMAPEYEWEILMVNDGSHDLTLNVIKQLRSQDNRVCFIDLSRNFGKENAMLAGFDHVTGDCMIIMDADMQDPPSLIPEMIEWWEKGYEDVYAKRDNRGKESWLRKRLSLLYYSILQKTTRFDVLQNVGDFRLLDRKCINELRNLRESERYTKGMFSWIGFKKKELLFNREDRAFGASSFNLLKLTNLAVEGITSFTIAPLRFSTFLGFAVSIFAFVYMCFVLVKALLFGDPVQGYPTMMTVILFLGGVQLLSLGIIGEYLGRVFYETKKRPVYIIEEKEGV